MDDNVRQNQLPPSSHPETPGVADLKGQRGRGDLPELLRALRSENQGVLGPAAQTAAKDPQHLQHGGACGKPQVVALLQT